MQNTILKTMQTASLALIAACAVVGCQTRPGPEVVSIPFDQGELVDSWIGFNNRDATCYKLILKEGGDGVLYSRFQEGTSATNTIAKWEVEGNVLRCEFLHDGSPTSAALLKCDIKKTLLVATLTGVGGWKDNIQFRRSQFIEASLSEAKALVPSENTSAVPHKR
jgi:hypothetical protein